MIEAVPSPAGATVRQRSDRAGALGQLVLRILTRGGAAAATLVTVHIETARFGRAGWGLFATATALVTLLGVVEDLGLETVGVRQLAEAPRDRQRLFATALSLRLALSMVAAALAVGLADLGWHERTLLVVVAGLSPLLVADAVLSATSAVFQAAHRLAVSGVFELVGAVLTLAAAMAVVTSGLPLPDLALTTGGAAVVGAGASLVAARRFVPISFDGDLRGWTRLLMSAAPFALMLVVSAAYAQIDTLILSVVRGSSAVGTYGVATLITQLVASFGSFAMAIALPRLSGADRAGRMPWLRWLSVVLYGLVLPACVGTTLLAPSIVVMVAGRAFASAAVPLALLMAGAAVTLPTGVLATALIADHRESQLLAVGMAVLAVNVGMNLWLARRWGAIGSAEALAVSEVVALVGTAAQFWRSAGNPWPLLRPPKRAIAAATAPALAWIVLVPTGAVGPAALPRLLLVGLAMAASVALCWAGGTGQLTRREPVRSALRKGGTR